MTTFCTTLGGALVLLGFAVTSCSRSSPPTAAPMVHAPAAMAQPVEAQLGDHAASAAAPSGRELLAYIRATARYAGDGPFDWATDATEACADGEHAPATARAAAACFAQRASSARQDAATIRAIPAPASLREMHDLLVHRIDGDVARLDATARALAASASEIDRRRGRRTWKEIWGGSDDDLPAITSAHEAFNANDMLEEQTRWISTMNGYTRALRCSNRELGGVQVRCQWRRANDAATGAETAFAVVADSDSPLPACDGTRAPCHDPPGGWPQQ